MPLTFRRSGDREWRQGTTENISRSGVLFRAPELMDQETPLEMCFTLPFEVSGRPAAQVICRGAVVRVVPAAGTQSESALAATIRRYRFLRPKGQSA